MTRISSLEGLAEWPKNRELSEFSCAIVEAPWGVEFCDLSIEGQRKEAQEYPKGIAFGETSELRWLKREGGLHFVYISDDGGDLGPGSAPADLLEAAPGLGDSACGERLLLWGVKQTDGTYHEGRIPRLLSYPAWAPEPKPGGRLAVTIKRYELQDREHAVALFRCVRLVKVED